MIKYENECVGCPPEMGCIGNACKYRRVPHCTCDTCHEELDPKELYEDEDGGMICAACILKRYTPLRDAIWIWDEDE